MYTVHSILKFMVINSCFALFLGCNILSCLIWSQNFDEIFEEFILLKIMWIYWYNLVLYPHTFLVYPHGKTYRDWKTTTKNHNCIYIKRDWINLKKASTSVKAWIPWVLCLSQLRIALNGFLISNIAFPLYLNTFFNLKIYDIR